MNVWSAEEKIDYEEDQKIELLQNDWRISRAAIDVIFNRIHMPCGNNIFNFSQVIQKAEQDKKAIEKEQIEQKEMLKNAKVIASYKPPFS